MVGNMDPTPECYSRKKSLPPRVLVLIYLVPGTDILSCSSTFNAYTDAAYWGNSVI